MRNRYSFNVHPVVKHLLLRHRWTGEPNQETYNRVFAGAIARLQSGEEPPALTFTYALDFLDVRCNLRLLAQYHAFDLMGDGSEVEVTVGNEKVVMRDMHDPGPWSALISFRADSTVETYILQRRAEQCKGIREAMMAAVQMAVCMPVQPEMESPEEAYRLLQDRLPPNTEVPIEQAIETLCGKASDQQARQILLELKRNGRLLLGHPSKAWRTIKIGGKQYRSIKLIAG